MRLVLLKVDFHLLQESSFTQIFNIWTTKETNVVNINIGCKDKKDPTKGPSQQLQLVLQPMAQNVEVMDYDIDFAHARKFYN